MSKPRPSPETDKQHAAPQRRQLEHAEENAAAQQPGSYKKAETADKLVEIPPDKTNKPIRGIDPKR